MTFLIRKKLILMFHRMPRQSPIHQVSLPSGPLSCYKPLSMPKLCRRALQWLTILPSPINMRAIGDADFAKQPYDGESTHVMTVCLHVIEVILDLMLS